MHLYIPVIHPRYTESDIVRVFYDNWIADVYRVDFMDTFHSGKKIRSAYVQLSSWFNSKLAYELYEIIADETNYVPEKTYLLYISNNDNEYWMIRRDESCNMYEKRIAELEEKVYKLYEEKEGYWGREDSVLEEGEEREEKESVSVSGKHTRFIEMFGDVVDCMEGLVVQN